MKDILIDKDHLPPDPPARLFDDRRVLNRKTTPAWETRRASKMRERFPVTDHQPLRALSLTAPVQPSIGTSNPFQRPL